MERIEISRSSDLTLTVHEDLELCVSSVVLCNTSEVFRAMLKPSWAEGQALKGANETSPANIKLPDDDSSAMRFLVAALHHRYDLFEEKISVELMHKVALLADKYACTTALKYVASSWFEGITYNDLCIWSEELVEAAFMLDHPKGFGVITNRVVREDNLPDFENVDSFSPLVDIYGE